MTRAELNSRFGGGIQGGMLTPAGGRLMFLFADPVSGETYGYTTDGWANDEHTRFSYTGEGAVGPQTVTKGKNRVLLDSLHTGREVHLFYAVDTIPNARTRVHEYIGRFDLDRDVPWRPETTLDQRNEPRTAVVFNLVRRGGERLASERYQTEATRAPKVTIVEEVPREASESLEFERSAIGSLTVIRREREFEDSLIEWLREAGKGVKRLRIHPAGVVSPLFTDTWVPASRELFEVKGDATRYNIRMAIGQLLDYRRHISPPPAASVIVVPIRPSIDLIDLVASVGLSLAVFDVNGLTYLGPTEARS